MVLSKAFSAELKEEPENKSFSILIDDFNIMFKAVLRIHDILVLIRMRIRILLFLSLTFNMPTKN
jgi:hypothetical protein